MDRCRRCGVPPRPGDRRRGIRYDISIYHAEFGLTQFFDDPVQGRVFFERALREHPDCR